MIALNSIRRTASMGFGAIVAVALLTSASQAQQAFPSPEDAAAALVALFTMLFVTVLALVRVSRSPALR